MRPRRRHVLPVFALAAGLTGAAPALGADGTRVWMTTGDRQNLLTQQSDASMAAPAALINCIVADLGLRLGEQAVVRLQALEAVASEAGIYVSAGGQPVRLEGTLLAWDDSRPDGSSPLPNVCR